jgi:AraC-like DNA-binding protein
MANVTLDWLRIIALLGTIQGVFLAGVLATKRTNRTANRLLAVLMVSFSIFLATSVYHVAGLEQRFPHFFGFGHPQVFLFGPLIYLYAISAADRNRVFTRRDALHFLPFLATVVIGLPVYLSSGPEKIEFYNQLRSGNEPLHLVIIDQLKLVSGTIYSVLTIAFLRRHRERVKESYSSTERVNLRWLLWLGASAAGIWLMAIMFQVVGFTRGDDYISLAISVLVYGIGYMGLRQPEIFRFETAEYPVTRLHTANERADETADEKADETAGLAGPRYERSGLTDREAGRLKDALMAVMDNERPWRDSGLTLADLAARLNTTPHKLSEVLNSQLGQTFYDFVNGYRVREVQRRIAAGDGRALKMLSLALDAGFASKSTFNQVFKKFTSQTPSDYRQAAGA